MAEQVILNYYVDDVDNDEVVSEAIKAMLSTLDPHSSYTDPKETEELTKPLEGKFSGIGVAFNMISDTVYVVSTVAGGPSERVGIQAGDRILMAGDSSLVGRDRTAVMGFLRGDKGTKVDLKVRRGKSDINFRVTRDDIPIYSVDAAYMVDDHTGYIRVSRFAEDTANEVLEALVKLDKKGMRDLIIDLQDNTGGYLGSAYELAEIFLRKGDPVVSTRGSRVKPMHYDTQRDGLMTDGRLVILVNQFSASASEILAGAIQDNDRGWVVGRRSFGKGLVQVPIELPDRSMIKLTVSRYYTPSGRSIQKPYTKGDRKSYDMDAITRYNNGELTNADSIHFPDSLRYYTRKQHRTVYGGGGIMPDRFVPLDTTRYTPLYRKISARGLIVQANLRFLDKNRKRLAKQWKQFDEFKEQFEMPEETLDAILAEAEEKELKPKDEEERLATRRQLARTLKALAARDLWDMSEYFAIVYEDDPVVLKAVEMIEGR